MRSCLTYDLGTRTALQFGQACRRLITERDLLGHYSLQAGRVLFEDQVTGLKHLAIMHMDRNDGFVALDCDLNAVTFQCADHECGIRLVTG